MRYVEALAYINSVQERLGSDYSLRDVSELAKRAGNPEKSLKVIHIAGTNGKGSVGNYISNMLAKSGYTVGRYVSPTIFEYRERIQKLICDDSGKDGAEAAMQPENMCSVVKSVYMSETEMAKTVTYLKEICEKMVEDGFHQPTAFEMETVMAFLLFQAWNVDVAVVECGLGGRLDATNIIQNPMLCVFTSISMDHMQILGDSVIKIAKEKYGIIQKGTVVVSKYQMECEETLRRICKEKNAELIFMSDSELSEGEYKLEKTRFQYRGVSYVIRQGGIYQLENAALALESVRKMQKMGFSNITEKTIREGLFESRWAGRFDLISRTPFLLVDGAHNADAAKKLKKSLMSYFPEETFSFIIGMFRDKEYEKVLRELMPLAKNVYVVKAPGMRGLESGMLCESVCKAGVPPEKVFDCSSMDLALKKAVSENKNGKTVICGSLSILQEVYRTDLSCFRISGARRNP